MLAPRGRRPKSTSRRQGYPTPALNAARTPTIHRQVEQVPAVAPERSKGELRGLVVGRAPAEARLFLLLGEVPAVGLGWGVGARAGGVLRGRAEVARGELASPSHASLAAFAQAWAAQPARRRKATPHQPATAAEQAPSAAQVPPATPEPPPLPQGEAARPSTNESAGSQQAKAPARGVRPPRGVSGRGRRVPDALTPKQPRPATPRYPPTGRQPNPPDSARRPVP